MSSTLSHTPLVLGLAAPALVAQRAQAYARVAGARLGQKLVGPIDLWWLAASVVSLVSLLLVSGWPDRAGLVSDGLTVGMVVTFGVAVLLYVTRRAEAQLTLNKLPAIERRQALTTELALTALTSADLPLVMQEAVALVARSLDVEYCAVLESMPDDSTLVLRAGWGWPAASVGQPVIAHSDSSQPPAPWQHGHGVRSGISVGLQVGQRAYGLLDVYAIRERVFGREEVEFVQTVAEILGAAIERSQVDAARQAREVDLTHRALHDTLTGLPNRDLFDDRLRHALARVQREPVPIAVLFVDLDNFKAINDTLGHSAGDDVLIQVADRLTQCLRDGDTAARLGGDEFAIVLERATELEATQVASRIQEALQSITVSRQLPPVSASIGIAISSGHAADIEALVRQADLAMYRAKRTRQQRPAVLVQRQSMLVAATTGPTRATHPALVAE
jgi:diguanylate cyclase (GGDEF)-like protein